MHISNIISFATKARICPIEVWPKKREAYNPENTCLSNEIMHLTNHQRLYFTSLWLNEQPFLASNWHFWKMTRMSDKCLLCKTKRKKTVHSQAGMALQTVKSNVCRGITLTLGVQAWYLKIMFHNMQCIHSKLFALRMNISELCTILFHCCVHEVLTLARYFACLDLGFI